MNRQPLDSEVSQLVRFGAICRELKHLLKQEREATIAYLRRRGGVADDYADDIEEGRHLLDMEEL